LSSHSEGTVFGARRRPHARYMHGYASTVIHRVDTALWLPAIILLQTIAQSQDTHDPEIGRSNRPLLPLLLTCHDQPVCHICAHAASFVHLRGRFDSERRIHITGLQIVQSEGSGCSRTLLCIGQLLQEMILPRGM